MIQISDLIKRFDEKTVLNRLNCTIPEGCVYGLVGSNGSGKSTLLRLISGIYRPESGTITIDGQPVFDNPAVKNRIVFVPDELFFLPHANLRRMEKLYASVYERFSHERFEALLKDFGLDPEANLNTFSKGMRRQAATILALSCRADFILFDETFDGLDPVMRHLVKRLLMEEIADREVTVIMTSHNLRELEDMCDHIDLLHNGHIIFERDIDDMRLSVHKIQMAFREPPPKEAFDKIEYMHFEQRGSVILMIVRGSEDEVMERMKAFDPTILEMIPLTLEEVFIYEMEVAGYDLEKMQ